MVYGMETKIIFMNQKAAMDLWDYIDEHQDERPWKIAEALGITIQEAVNCISIWASRVRGEFIFYLTKQNADTSGHPS